MFSIRLSFHRLEHDNDNSKETLDIYVKPRMFSFITAFIWLSFSVFFRSRVSKTIDQICLKGNLSSLGGRVKRNIITLGIVPVLVIIYHDIIFFFRW